MSHSCIFSGCKDDASQFCGLCAKHCQMHAYLCGKLTEAKITAKCLEESRSRRRALQADRDAAIARAESAETQNKNLRQENETLRRLAAERDGQMRGICHWLSVSCNDPSPAQAASLVRDLVDHAAMTYHSKVAAELAQPTGLPLYGLGDEDVLTWARRIAEAATNGARYQSALIDLIASAGSAIGRLERKAKRAQKWRAIAEIRKAQAKIWQAKAKAADLANEDMNYELGSAAGTVTSLRHEYDRLSASHRVLETRFDIACRERDQVDAERARLQRIVDAIISHAPDSFFDEEQVEYRSRAAQALEANGWIPPEKATAMRKPLGPLTARTWRRGAKFKIKGPHGSVGEVTDLLSRRLYVTFHFGLDANGQPVVASAGISVDEIEPISEEEFERAKNKRLCESEG